MGTRCDCREITFCIVQIHTGTLWRRHTDQLRDGEEGKEMDWRKGHHLTRLNKQKPEVVQVPTKQPTSARTCTNQLSYSIVILMCNVLLRACVVGREWVYICGCDFVCLEIFQPIVYEHDREIQCAQP